MSREWHLEYNADIFYANYFLRSSYVSRSREKYANVGDRMGFSDILQSVKSEKNVKTLIFRVALDSLRTVLQVFETFPSSRPNNFEKFKCW